MASVGLFRLPEAGLTPRVAPLGTANKPLPIIIDCDPGLDDALAIACAVVRPELNLLAVTSVGGNADVRHCTENALRLLQLYGAADVPVAEGAVGPLSGPLERATEIHGATGLGSTTIPAAARKAARWAATYFSPARDDVIAASRLRNAPPSKSMLATVT